MRAITSFALYGFPESHAASFALLAYASAYLKAHHPAAFTCALLNNWPMGFYHPATLVKDAQRHGVAVRPVDVTRSDWKCTLEAAALRLGFATSGLPGSAAGGSSRPRRAAVRVGGRGGAARRLCTRTSCATLADVGGLAPARARAARGAVAGRAGGAARRGRCWRGRPAGAEPSPLRR